MPFSMISFFRFVMVMTSSFSLFLFDNLTERGAKQLVFRTPTLTPTRTPTGVIRSCFSLFVIVRKPLKNLRFWILLIQENRPIFSSSPVATTPKPLIYQGFSLFDHSFDPHLTPTGFLLFYQRASKKFCILSALSFLIVSVT